MKLWIVILPFLLSSCFGKWRVHAYEGPPRPRSEVAYVDEGPIEIVNDDSAPVTVEEARLTLGEPSLRAETVNSIVEFDDRALFLFSNVICLPGHHEMLVSPMRVWGWGLDSDRDTLEEAAKIRLIEFEALAGSRYIVKSIGTETFNSYWPYVQDDKTGEIIAWGRKLREEERNDIVASIDLSEILWTWTRSEGLPSEHEMLTEPMRIRLVHVVDGDGRLPDDGFQLLSVDPDGQARLLNDESQLRSLAIPDEELLSFRRALVENAFFELSDSPLTGLADEVWLLYVQLGWEGRRVEISDWSGDVTKDAELERARACWRIVRGWIDELEHGLE